MSDTDSGSVERTYTFKECVSVYAVKLRKLTVFKSHLCNLATERYDSSVGSPDTL